MITRKGNTKQFALNIVGSSVFGRYAKINSEFTYNMFASDNFMVPYAGYEIAISAANFGNGKIGRGCFTSTKFNRIVTVIDDRVYLTTITYNQTHSQVQNFQVSQIGTLQTSSGVVYITENNKPQIAISDGTKIYIYDPANSPTLTIPTIHFVPGYITYHDSRFLCAASQDTAAAATVRNNTWRLSELDSVSTGMNPIQGGLSWPDSAAFIGQISTKPDNTQAVVRFPSKGNMIMVMGSIVSEAWFDVGAKLFPYQRTTQFNIDYGCLSPATVAYMDELVVWLAANEKSGPIIMYSNGGMPDKVTDDGIDYLFSQLNAPQDSQAFLYRQDGHLFYHINFYTDNLSLFVDFLPDGSRKIYHASDQDLNYFIASQVAFFNNQYYFVTRNNGNLFAFDTIFTTYEDVDAKNNVITHEIPRIRTCKNIRLPSQEYFIANDIGFTIETGETNYQQQSAGPINLITEDGKLLITEGNAIFLETQDGNLLYTEDGNSLVAQGTDSTDFSFLISEQENIIYTTPRVDMSISRDGGATFGSDYGYTLNPIGQRKNRLMWWQVGIANDMVCQFKFWGLGRFVVTDGILNIRQ